MVRETRHLWVGNLPETVREDRIREHFKRYGRVQSVKILLPQAFNSSLLHLSNSSNTTSDTHNTKDQYNNHQHHYHHHNSHHHNHQQNNDATTTTTGDLCSTNVSSGSCTNVSNTSICNSSINGNNTTNSSNIHNNSSSNNNTISNNSNSASNINNCSTQVLSSSQQQSLSSSVANTNVISTLSASTSCPPSAVPTNNAACTTNCTSMQLGNSVCATIAFMDIKSASKAHTAEHKFDDRVLTTEYYEPSSIPSTSGENSPSSNCSSSSHHHHHHQSQTSSNYQLQALSNVNNSDKICLQSNIVSAPQQYSSLSSSTSILPTGSINSASGQSANATITCRFPTPNRGSSEDRSPVFTERPTFYDRSSRSTNDNGEQYIRRPNNYHISGSVSSGNNNTSGVGGVVSGDVRGRARDRLYRNGPYSTVIDRSNPVSLHRISSSSWYESSNSTTRSIYGSVASAVVTPDNIPFEISDRRPSETTTDGGSSTKSSLTTTTILKKKKSRSGSESPSCGGSASSRSHSRSPSSCSSTNSHSSNSQASSSPVSGSDPSRSRNIQSAVSTPATNSSSNSNPAVHSEDNRPLAICVRNLPSRSSDTSLKDGLFHEYKKHGKVTWVKVVGQSSERYALVCFKKPDDVDKALEVSHDKLFFGCKIEVAPYQGFDVEDNEFRPYEAELDEYHPKSTRTLFIGNLEKDITASELRKHFDCFGEIIEIDIKKQGVNAYAFCQYSDIISVVKAMRQMDGEHLGSNRIKLGFGKSMPTNCVWIDGISDSVSESYLTTQFNRFGPVSQVATDRDRKLALVFFEQIQYAQTAVKEMRGVTLRGRKLQVDFASRECQDAFYDKLEKQGGLTTVQADRISVTGNSGNSANFDSNNVGREVTTRGFETTVVVPGTRFNRYDGTSGGRSRASSFSRHSVGATSPGAVGSGSTTPRGGGSRRGRYSTASEYHDGETGSDRRFKSYDEYSQGSGASHEDENYNYFRDRPDSPLNRLTGGGGGGCEIDSIAIRRRSEKSPIVSGVIVADDEYFSSSGSTTNVCVGKHNRIQSVVVPASANDTQSTQMSQSSSILFPPPGDIRHLQKERYHLLEQLEEYPSSGDELVSPKKRIKFDPCIDSISSVQTNLISDPNCDVIINHNNESCNVLLHHRKGVEVRRLSECSNSFKQLQHQQQLHQSIALSGIGSNTVNNSTSSSSSRRPSTDSISRHSNSRDSHDHVINMFSPHATCKRRKTGNSISESEHHSSRGRGHQLHSHHSHEASGGESADGSRPGTPLCDERPENLIPTEPRRIPRERLPNAEPLYLPLPKFAIQLFQQNRLFTTSSSTTTFEATTPTASSFSKSSSYLANHSSLSNTLASPPPALLSRPTTTHNNTILQQQPQQQQQHLPQQPQQQHNLSQTPLTPLILPNSVAATTNTTNVDQPPASPSRAPSLSSNSSDSEMTSGNSPSIEDRIKNLDEMFEKWSGGNTNRTHTFSDSIINTTPSSFASRHKFLDLDVHEVQPSDIVKSVLAKKSIFDDDLKRLENIGDKYEPRDFANISRSLLNNTTVTQPLVSTAGTPTVTVPTTVLAASTKPTLIFQAPAINQLQQQRLSVSSPLNSPQPISPYSSPSPSPVIGLTAVTTPNNKAGTPNCAAKGLQYPFPSHPPINTVPPPLPLLPAMPPAVQPNPPPPATISAPSPPLPPVIPPITTTPIPTTIPITKSITTTVPSDQATSCVGVVETIPIIKPKQSSNLPPTITPACGSSADKSTNPRNLTKSSSIPGSTNVGTVKSINVHHNETSNIDSLEDNNSNKGGSKSRRSSQDLNNSQSATASSSRLYNRTISAPTISNKSDKTSSSKQNSNIKSENERKRRTDSLDRRKNHDCEILSNETQSSNDIAVSSKESVTASIILPSIATTTKITEEDRMRKEKEEQETINHLAERIDSEQKKTEDKKLEVEVDCHEENRQDKKNDDQRDTEKSDQKVKKEEERFDHDSDVKEYSQIKGDEELLLENKLDNEKRLIHEPESKPSHLNLVNYDSPHEDVHYNNIDAHIDHDSTTHHTDINHDSPLKHNKDDRHNKENAQNVSRENTPFYSNEIQKHERTSPQQISAKRRLSIQESVDDGKRFKFNMTSMTAETTSSGRKVLDRRDFKDPNRSSEKSSSKHHHRHTKTGSSKNNSSIVDEKMFNAEERIRKDSGFDERRKDRNERHRSKDRNEKHKNRRNKEDSNAAAIAAATIVNHVANENTNEFDMRALSEKCYQHHIDHDMQRSSEDEHKKNDYSRELLQKKYDIIGNIEDQPIAYRQYGSGDTKQRDDRKSEKRNDRHNSGDRRSNRGGGGADDSSHTTSSSAKSYSERRSRLRKQNANSSDDSDSDEPKKHSIFDIPDDGPAYISMYDKVKARSCKNMQKQEEEKKIKAKFSQLKQSRAKREEKKSRFNSWDEDSDSDADMDRRQQKPKSKSSGGGGGGIGGINTSSDDDEPRPISDTESEPRRNLYHRNRLNELCDGESSESSIAIQNHKPRRKISSRKNSRSTRIASDSSDDGGGVGGNDDGNRMQSIKSEPTENRDKSPSSSPEQQRKLDNSYEEETFKAKVKIERFSIDDIEHQKIKDESNSGKSKASRDDFKGDLVKMEIKSEPKEEIPLNNYSNIDDLQTMDKKPDVDTTSDVHESKDSIFDHLFSPESRKKHKKNKKKQKSFHSSMEILSGADHLNDKDHQISGDAKSEKPQTISPMETVFDELKKDITAAEMFHHEKRRHSSRKEKKRDKSKEEHERSREERYRLKKLKKQAKLSSSGDAMSLFDSQDASSFASSSNPVTPSTTAAFKRGEKMEDIFGPISDDDSRQSINAEMSPKTTTGTLPNTNTSLLSLSSGNLPPIPVTPGKNILDNITPENIGSQGDAKTSKTTAVGNPTTPSNIFHEKEKEKHREKKKEKKRKEREKLYQQQQQQQQQLSITKDDENSADLDAAGRAVEAQLMDDSDIKSEPSVDNNKSLNDHSTMDVFRFSDGDESLADSVTTIGSVDKKLTPDITTTVSSIETHRMKEKKKKKKRSKDEKHQRHHHHHSSSHSSSLMSPPSTPKLSIDITSPRSDVEDDTKVLFNKQSPSLPCLMDEPELTKFSAGTTGNISCSENAATSSKQISAVSPVPRDPPLMISPIPKTPTAPPPTSKLLLDTRKEPKKLIPAFGAAGACDEKIHETAVQSISSDYTPAQVDLPKHVEPTETPKIDEKCEEKSRVVISQEETEDAVAALLGESFGTSSTTDYNDCYEPDPIAEEVLPAATGDTIIAEEEAEEMRKAVQSLNNEELDIIPGTPQSETDLQIDTDTEDQDDESIVQLRFDNPPKTPDVDMSQIRRSMAATTQNVPKESEAEIAKETKVENVVVAIEPPTNAVINTIEQPKSSSTASSVVTTKSVITKALTSESKIKSATTPIVVESDGKDAKLSTVAVRSTAVSAPTTTPTKINLPDSNKPIIMENRILVAPVSASVVIQGQHNRTTNIIGSRPQLIYTTQPRLPGTISSQSIQQRQQVRQPGPRPIGQFTVTTPSSGINYQQFGVMVSAPRSNVVGAADTRMNLPRPQQTFVKSSPPQSPNFMRQQSPRQLTPTHSQIVIQQQNQLLSSGPMSLQQQKTVTSTSPTSTAHIMINRLPMTPVLAPISSKPIQPTTMTLPQPNVAQSSHTSSGPVGKAIAISMPNNISIGNKPPTIGTTNMEPHTVVTYSTVRINSPSNVLSSSANKQQHQQQQTTQQISKQVVTVDGNKMQKTVIDQRQPIYTQGQTMTSQQQPLQQQPNLQQQMQVLRQMRTIQLQPQQQTIAQYHAQQSMAALQHKVHPLPSQQQSPIIKQTMQFVPQQQPSQSQHIIQTHSKPPTSLTNMHQSVPLIIKSNQHDNYSQSTSSSSSLRDDANSGKNSPLLQQHQLLISASVNPTTPPSHISMAHMHPKSPKPDAQTNISVHTSTAIPFQSLHQQQHSPKTIQHQSIQSMRSQSNPSIQSPNKKGQQQQNIPETKPSIVGSIASTAQTTKPLQTTLTSSIIVKPELSPKTDVSTNIHTTRQEPQQLKSTTASVKDQPPIVAISETTSSSPHHHIIAQREPEKPICVVAPICDNKQVPVETPKTLEITKNSLINVASVATDIKTVIQANEPTPSSTQNNSTQSAASNANQQAATAKQSLLTEENVTKLTTSSATLPIDDQQDSKEDSDYWSAKEVNIDSVIKKVDALCSSSGEESSVQNEKCEKIQSEQNVSLDSTNDGTKSSDEQSQKVDNNNKRDEDELIDEGIVTVDSKITAKNSPTIKRGGNRPSTRGGSTSSGSKKQLPSSDVTVTTPVTTGKVGQKSSVAISADTPSPEPATGVQTRRGVTRNQSKRGRGGGSRNTTTVSPSTPKQAGSTERKLRNQNSESDIYEFHEDDSGEETVASSGNQGSTVTATTTTVATPTTTVVTTTVTTNTVAMSTPTKSSTELSRPRLILTIKGQQAAVTPTTSSSLNPIPQQTAHTVILQSTPSSVQSSQSPKLTSLPADIQLNTPIANTSKAITATSVSTVSQSVNVLQMQTVTAQHQGSSQQQQQISNQEPTIKDDFSAPTSGGGNVRKSRRLLERDGTRSTVDDIIEDVIKASGTSPKQGQTIVTTVVSTSSSQTPPRRSTRNSSQLSNVKPSVIPAIPTPIATPAEKPNATAAVNSVVDIRKSPRANRRTKDRKASDTSADSSDEKLSLNKPSELESKMQPVQVASTSTVQQPQEQHEEEPMAKVSLDVSKTMSIPEPVDASSLLDTKPLEPKIAPTVEKSSTTSDNKSVDAVDEVSESKVSEPKVPVVNVASIEPSDKPVELETSKVVSDDSAIAKPVVAATSMAQTINSLLQKSSGVDGEQPLTLIDPVTGELTVVRQSKEGQYVPVPGVKSPHPVVISRPITTDITTVVVSTTPTTVAQPSTPVVVTTAPSTVTKTVISTQQQLISASQPVVTLAKTVTQPGSSIAQTIQNVVQSSVAKVQPPQQIHPQQQQSSLMTKEQPPSTVVVSTSGNVVTQTVVVQQIQQQPKPVQQQPVRAHPLKAHVLNSQISKTINAATPTNIHTQSQMQLPQQHLHPLQQQSHQPQPQPKHIQQQQPQPSQSVAIKVLTTANTSLPIQQSSIISKPNSSTSYIVQNAAAKTNVFSRTSSPLVVPSPQQQIHNLHVNVLPSGVMNVGKPTALSPRIQSSKLIAHQTLMDGSHIHQQQQQLHSKQANVIPPSAHAQQIVIHASKQPMQSMGPNTGYSTIVQGGKTTIVQQSQSKPANVMSLPTSTATSVHQLSKQQQQLLLQQQQQHHVSARNVQQQQHLLQQTVSPQLPSKVNVGVMGNISVVTHQQQHQPISKQTGGQQQLPHIHTTPSKIHSSTIHHQLPSNQTIQQASGSQHIMTCGTPSMGAHQTTTSNVAKIVLHQQQQQLQQQQPSQQLSSGGASKSSISLQQVPQIMTGAVASPPLKQSHLNSQQPIVTGASSSRVTVPSISPQGQSARTHVLQPGLQSGPAFEANLHGEINRFVANRSQSPPPAHQQTSPITPGDGTFSAVPLRGVTREHYIMYQHIRQQEGLGHSARIPYIQRSPLLPGSVEQKDLVDMDEQPLGTSPVLELRGPRTTIAVPHSLQSPQERATDSPQVAQVYVHGSRIPPPHFPDVGTRFYENPRQIPITPDPPPAHRAAPTLTPSYSNILPSQQQGLPSPSASSSSSTSSSVPTTIGSQQQSNLHLQHSSQQQATKLTVVERENREQRDKERSSIPVCQVMPSHGSSLVPAIPTGSTGRNLQVATPPHASQVPPQADSLLMLLQRYPVMWQGLLALKTDQAAVQMHFVFGNPRVASGSLPCNSDGSTPPLRIAQRMRLEQTQLEGVARKMQTVNEHCMLLALPCGRDHMDVLQQSTNLQTGFITYLQQKQAAGIVNIPAPGSEQAAYVVHIFPSCDFANENLARIAPDLLHRVADIAHLLIVIATV